MVFPDGIFNTKVKYQIQFDQNVARKNSCDWQAADIAEKYLPVGTQDETRVCFHLAADNEKESCRIGMWAAGMENLYIMIQVSQRIVFGSH